MDMLTLVRYVLHPDAIRAVVEISLLWVIIYYALRLIVGTRAMQVVIGLLIVGLLAVVARLASLRTFNWIFENAFSQIFIIIAVIFGYELRRAFARLGAQRGLLIQSFIGTQSDIVHEVVEAATYLAKRRWGGIVVIQRDADLEGFIETGCKMDCQVSSEVLSTIFTPYSPLHDRAVIIDGQRIAAASCLLPLSEREEIDSELGTRHRAALGITEETDAVAVVISEEQGTISLAVNGNLSLALDGPALERTLTNILTGGGGE